MTKKIALVGTAPSWKDAPFKDKDWDIWSWNLTGIKLERWDVLFEIHRRFVKSDDDYLNNQLPKVKPPKIVFSIIPFKQCPANRLLPWKELKLEWGQIWLSSSIAVAFAVAIEEKPDEIGLWGCDFESLEEYIVQFAAIRHFMWIAEDRGIKIRMPDDCLLLREPNPYPDRFETIQALVFERKAKHIQGLIHEVESKLDHHKSLAFGTMAEIETMERYNAPKEDIKQAKKEAHQHIINQIVVNNNLHRLKGELFATQHYRRLFAWNVLPPELGEESNADIEDCGPI